MKFKKVLLALPIAATALLFAYCAKEPQVTVANEQTGEIVERGICQVTVAAINCTVDLCGVQNNAVLCGNVGGMPSFGAAQLGAGNAALFVMNTPAAFRATLAPGFPIGPNPSISVASGGVVKNYPIAVANPAATAVPAPTIVKINNFCVPQ